MVTIQVEQTAVAFCTQCGQDTVTFEPIPGEPLDCIRCRGLNTAMPVEPAREAVFVWTEKDVAKGPVERRVIAGPFVSVDAAQEYIAGRGADYVRRMKGDA